jgi:hypothetical protein
MNLREGSAAHAAPGSHPGASQSAVSPAAANQIGIVRAYFGFQAYGAIVGLALIPFARFLAPTVTVHGNPWVVMPLLAVNTWAAFRTRRLLRERDPDGAWMAGATFGWNVIVATTAGHFGFGALLSGLGVLVAANIYGELRRAE